MEADFANCDLLESIGFEPDSQSLSIGKSTFQGSGLKWIAIPRAANILSESCFEAGISLHASKFEDDLQLITIDAFAFAQRRLKSIIQGVPCIREHLTRVRRKVNFSFTFILDYFICFLLVVIYFLNSSIYSRNTARKVTCSIPPKFPRILSRSSSMFSNERPTKHPLI
jgi:hypothetical protein